VTDDHEVTGSNDMREVVELASAAGSCALAVDPGESGADCCQISRSGLLKFAVPHGAVAPLAP
jgi:hypothetical protein